MAIPRAKKPRQPSDLEARFMLAWRALGGPLPVPEFRFDLERQWRFDFAWPDAHIAVEIEGGLKMHRNGARVQGRHQTEAGMSEDSRKYNAAARVGWRVFRLTVRELDDEPYLRDLSHFVRIERCRAEQRRCAESLRDAGGL